MPIRSYSLMHFIFRLMLPIAFFHVALHAGGEDVTRRQIASIPSEVSSSRFIVTVGANSSPVMHAAAGYYLLNFEIEGKTTITVTADDPHYWDAGVEVQPMRLGIRPHRQGGSISFLLDGPAKISITRPGEFFNDSEMLFLFANMPDRSGITSQTAGIRYYGPGVHRENIDAKSGDNIYLAAGAVIFGSLNIWQVHDVHVSGRGTIIYEGPQNPDHDEGWMHKPNWHVIVMDNAHNIDIEGITGVVRSRTWMVQLRDSTGIRFRNVKIVGGGPGNANQDGIDWLGGGDTLVQDSFFRAADDIFAMYGNWDGYDDKALTTPGDDVNNIIIENSVLSTSISNVVRLGWPGKVFNSHGFTLRDSDVIQPGIGSCGVPFALFEVWADPGGAGMHSSMQFENIRLDGLYSLVQLRQPNPAVSEVTMKDLWSMDGTAMAPSVLKGNISGVTFEDVDTGVRDSAGNPFLQVDVMDRAQTPTYIRSPIFSQFEYTGGLLRPHSEVVFKVVGAKKSGLHFHWLFGDGGVGDGSEVHHVYSDFEGTLLDGSGRFRVNLHVTDDEGHQSWNSQTLLIADSLHPSIPSPAPETTKRDVDFVRNVRVPVDGGYTFTLLSSTTATLAIDDLPAAKSPKPRPQVCGSPGNAVQSTRFSIALSAGLHTIRVARDNLPENAPTTLGEPDLYWEGPGISRQPIPRSALGGPQ